MKTLVKVFALGVFLFARGHLDVMSWSKCCIAIRCHKKMMYERSVQKSLARGVYASHAPPL